jgi:cation/acetate symporter
MAMPLALLAFSDQAYVAPGVDREAYRAALQQIAAWRGVDPPVDAWMAALAAALGAATLAPLLGPAIAVVNARASLRGGAAAIGGALGLGALALAVMATGALALLDSGAGRQPGAMAPALYAESAAKRLAVCGAYVSAPQEAESACRARTGAEGAALRPGDLAPRGLFLLTAPPLLAELGPAQTGLLWTAVMGFGFAIAAAALLGLATALGHDGVYRVRDASALTSRRLAITRLCLVCAIAALAYGLSQFAIDPALAMGLALAISAAGVAPVLLLAFVPIAAAPQAVLAALAGGAACAGSIVFGGLSLHFLTYAALNGAVIGFGAGLVASLLPIGDKSEARRLRAALVSRAGPIVAMDKGA